MIRLISSLIIFFSILSCTQQPQIDLVHLNGYWEINHVITANENQKKYNFNPTIDYFKTEDSIGFRTKLQPNFIGTYKGSKQKLNYTIAHKAGKYIITYKTISDTWNDILIEASPDQLCIENKEGTRYFYRKFTPIQLNEKK
ncbi:hypothetical protein [Aquimarina agarilytica]|uniref:hypothetical protein n=1 Tax=Aquimarina agarilytica TaxID=1087449 RepID=UPI0002885A9E|nr:hypothetical protein [Aquimarina agarilytica]